MPGLCEVVRASLPSLVDGEGGLERTDRGPARLGTAEGGPGDAGLAGHIDICLRCQAELAQYRRLRRALRRLRVAEATAPEGLARDVLGYVEAAAQRAVRREASRRRAAYALAVTAAGAGAVGLGAVWGHRRIP